ncbi:hypothetical protein [Streptomyces sp. NPDC051909]|uniref:hypothetical protein n=1 Tax=Streptomyces sp. NPDC051909 TaxID=3154944 RepID=UPI0034262A16
MSTRTRTSTAGRVLAAAALAAVVAAPAPAMATTATAATAMAAPAPAPAPTAPAPTAAKSTSPVRVVASGERVDAGGGFTIWLTSEGKHWLSPDGTENFRSVVDGNIDLSRPGVSHQSEGTPTATFHSGLFYGTKRAGQVVLTDADGRKTAATLLELPGRPGWGVWYAHRAGSVDGVGVALYDRNGRLLAELPPF